ncbi:MAG: hypothetical protein ACLQFR_31570 [Streptosporangiaceae bacterium]
MTPNVPDGPALMDYVADAGYQGIDWPLASRRRRAFCALGQGDVGREDVLAAIADIGYTGWVTVEQDIFPDPAEPPERPATDQVANREWLRARGI